VTSADTSQSTVNVIGFFSSYFIFSLVFNYFTRKKKIVGLERGPLSLVSTIEELLDRKVAAPV
jgi:hypothetical protein